MNIGGKDYYTITEAADKLGLGRQGVHWLIHHKWRGQCDPVQINGKVLIWKIPLHLVNDYASPWGEVRQKAGKKGANARHKL